MRRHYPELPDYGRPLTLRHLASNAGGVHDFLELLTVSGAGVARPVASAECAALICRQRTLNCEPGSAMIYSAGGFLILSLILERVTGKPMEALLADRLFEPLGMTSTKLMRTDNMVIADMATPYLRRPDGTFVRGGWGLEVNCEGAIVSSTARSSPVVA